MRLRANPLTRTEDAEVTMPSKDSSVFGRLLRSLPRGVKNLEQALLAWPGRSQRLLFVALFALISSTWVRPLASGYWLDETATAWISGGTFAEVLQRGSQFSGGHPFYYTLPWLSQGIFGHSEWALRLPSLLGMLASLHFLHRVARRFLDAEGALIALCIYASLQIVQFHARDARPYGTASLFLLAATHFTLRWRESERLRDGLYAALAFALVFHNHFIHALHGALLLAYAWRWRGKGRSPLPRHALLVVLFAGIAIAPGLPPFFRVADNYKSLVYSDPPQIEEFVWIVFNPETTRLLTEVASLGAAAGIAIWLLALGLGSPSKREALTPNHAALAGSSAAARTPIWPLFLWWLLPPTILFTVSSVTDARLFHARYMIEIASAYALLLAIVMRRIPWATLRLAIVLGFCLLVIDRDSSSKHHRHEWRRAAELVREQLAAEGDLPVLLRSGLIEARNIEWLKAGNTKAYIDAPFQAYPLKAEVHSLPYDLEGEEHAEYCRKLMANLVAPDGFLLVYRTAGAGPMRALLAEVAAARGFVAVDEPRALGTLSFERFGRKLR